MFGAAKGGRGSWWDDEVRLDCLLAVGRVLRIGWRRTGWNFDVVDFDSSSSNFLRASLLSIQFLIVIA